MTQSLNSKKTFLVLIILLLAILVALLFYIFKDNSKSTPQPSKYSAIYLKTGDIYFGELIWFPRLKIKNPWFLQRTTDSNNQAQVGIAPFADAFWKPINEISLNKDEIVFWTRLRSDSEVIPLISGKSNNSIPASQ